MNAIVKTCCDAITRGIIIQAVFHHTTRFAHATCTVRCCDDVLDFFLDEMHHVQEDALFERGAVATNR